MGKIKSYTNVWNVEKVIYAISDLPLPVPMTFSQMAWFVASVMAVIFLGNVPPLSMIDSTILKYLGIPAGFTWFMSRKTFDGKRPFRFLKSVVLYFFRQKVTYAGKAVRLRKQRISGAITAVRSEIYVPD